MTEKKSIDGDIETRGLKQRQRVCRGRQRARESEEIRDLQEETEDRKWKQTHRKAGRQVTGFVVFDDAKFKKSTIIKCRKRGSHARIHFTAIVPDESALISRVQGRDKDSKELGVGIAEETRGIFMCDLRTKATLP